MKKHLIANWKMEKTHTESLDWVTAYAHELDKLVTQNNLSLILCPSFTSLSQIASLLKDTAITVGAQECSAFERGPHTGQVSVLSLQEIGCTHCIIGHSEQRYYQTDEVIAQKAELLLRHSISPIICVGESAHTRKNKQTYEWLCKQLTPLFQKINNTKANVPLFIAYEPLWAVGTDHFPTYDELYEISQWIHEILSSCLSVTSYLLYGGSVNDKNSPALDQLPFIDGFLIGRASTKIEVLRNIIMNR